MLSSVVQPATVSVFSSTGTEPLKLFGTRIDASLPSDSFVHLLHDRLSQPLPPLPAALIVPPPLCDVEEGGKGPGYSLDQTVLHIQSPTLPTTYIQCPAAVPTGSLGARDLGIKHPWIHLQVRNLGREWSFEVGLVDQSGRVGVLRLSTFQVHIFFNLHNLTSSGSWDPDVNDINLCFRLENENEPAFVTLELESMFICFLSIVIPFINFSRTKEITHAETTSTKIKPKEECFSSSSSAARLPVSNFSAPNRMDNYLIESALVSPLFFFHKLNKPKR